MKKILFTIAFIPLFMSLAFAFLLLILTKLWSTSTSFKPMFRSITKSETFNERTNHDRM